MNRCRLLFAVTLLATLCACAAPKGTVTTAAIDKHPPLLANGLPCATTLNHETLEISYPTESLYHSGAALPTREGLVCLEALASWLKNTQDAVWLITLAGEEGYGFDSLQLADKRQQLLQRFLLRKGVETTGWQWQSISGKEVQLKLQQVKDSP